MPRSRPLPDGLNETFTVTDAIGRGVSPDALRRVELRTPYRGLRSFAAEPEADDLRARCLEYRPRLRPWQFFSHETALDLLGAPSPEFPYRVAIHVSAHRPAREPRIPGIVGHRLQIRESLVQPDDDDIPLEHPVRAWRQAAGQWGVDDLIAAGEFLISGTQPLCTIDELREETLVMGDVKTRKLSRALREMRVGARSPRETKLRLLLVRSGLPEPEINWVLRARNGVAVAELDLAYPRWRVAPEYDGRVHAEDTKQFARDADRWAAIRREGWDHVRILNHHMRGGGAVAVRMVADALARAGWSRHR
jgi:very-short-patch-repair endonuclease